MTDIFDELCAIPAVQSFLAEKPGLSTVPIAQRIREFLAQRYGSIWYGATVDSYASHESVIHAASLSGVRSLSIVIVVERNDGTLSCAVPLPPERPICGEEELY